MSDTTVKPLRASYHVQYETDVVGHVFKWKWHYLYRWKLFYKMVKSHLWRKKLEKELADELAKQIQDEVDKDIMKVLLNNNYRG